MMEYTGEGTVRAAYAEGRGGLQVTVTDHGGQERSWAMPHGVAMKLSHDRRRSEDAPLTCR